MLPLQCWVSDFCKMDGINNRNYIDVFFASPNEVSDSNFDLLKLSITDLEPEFRLSGEGIGTVSLDSSQEPLMIENSSDAPRGLTYRYFLNGQFADSGDVTLTFLQDSWSYQFNQTLNDVVVKTPNEEGNKTNIEPGGRAPIVLEVPVPNHPGLSLDAETIGTGSELFLDHDNDPGNGVQIHSSRSDVMVTIDLPETLSLWILKIQQLSSGNSMKMTHQC